MIKDSARPRKKRRVWRIIVLCLSLTLTASLLTCCNPLKPPIPPFLRDADENSGSWWSAGCPVEDASFEHADDEASAPNVVQRLYRRFPPGTPASALVQFLSSQGLQLIGSCDNGPSVLRARFAQGDMILPPFYPMDAIIAWKQDKASRIVWIKAMVEWTGL